MNQRHHIESLIIVAVAAYAAKHFSRKHSERRELCSRSMQIDLPYTEKRLIVDMDTNSAMMPFQRDAVVETLISHCQISAPLLKLFPIDWQRAIVGNILTLATAVVSDFAYGIQIQVLGHALSFSFKPITEADLIQHIGVGGFRQNHRRARPDEFEPAVWATAQDISEGLSFLDGWLEWLERKLGGGILRSQVGNLIARVVLTLIDEVLSGARLDLWSSQANGPRLYAALEYRTTAINEEVAESTI